MNNSLKSITLSSAVAVALASGHVAASENPFSATALEGGYQIAAEGKCGEAKCGADKKSDGKCGEAKCGADKKKTEGKCGEGKCGAA